MKTKKQNRLYMRKYLAIPENREAHNQMSNDWYKKKYATNKTFRNKRKKQIAAFMQANPEIQKRYRAKNRLALSMYYQLKSLDKKK